MGSAHVESEEEFEQRVLCSLSSGFLLPCVALGSKLGLFDKMAAFTQPVTALQLAEAMVYKERYVREWLDSMVCFRVFDYDSVHKTYFFPQSRQAMFTNMTGKQQKNIGKVAEMIPLLLRQFPVLLQCFREDGPRGVCPDSYDGFQDWKEEEAWAQFPEIRDRFLETELGAKLAQGVSVCDMGCGAGTLTESLAKHFPHSTFHGCDISPDAIDSASKLRKSSNLSFSVQDICKLPSDWSESFDLVVVFDVIHDLPFASRALQQIFWSLKPGGYFYMMDAKTGDTPAETSGLVYMVSLFYCLPQSLYYEGSEGLGTAWGVGKARQMISTAGFIQIRVLGHPGQAKTDRLHVLCQKPS